MYRSYYNVMMLLLCLVIFGLVHSLVPTTRSEIRFEPSLSYVTLDTALSKGTGQFIFSATSIYMLARKCKGRT